VYRYLYSEGGVGVLPVPLGKVHVLVLWVLDKLADVGLVLLGDEELKELRGNSREK